MEPLRSGVQPWRVAGCVQCLPSVVHRYADGAVMDSRVCHRTTSARWYAYGMRDAHGESTDDVEMFALCYGDSAASFYGGLSSHLSSVQEAYATWEQEGKVS